MSTRPLTPTLPEPRHPERDAAEILRSVAHHADEPAERSFRQAAHDTVVARQPREIVPTTTTSAERAVTLMPRPRGGRRRHCRPRGRSRPARRPVIGEMAPLNRVRRQVWVEQRDTRAGGLTATRIHDAVCARRAEVRRQGLTSRVAVRRQRFSEASRISEEVVRLQFDLKDDLAKLGRPALRLSRACHEARGGGWSRRAPFRNAPRREARRSRRS